MFRVILEEVVERLICRFGISVGAVQVWLLRIDGDPIARVVAKHSAVGCRHVRHITDLDVWQLVELGLIGADAGAGGEEERSDSGR